MRFEAGIDRNARSPRQARAVAAACAAALCAWMVCGRAALAVTPESPEVKKLIGSALAYLEKNHDDRLGGRCLVGLTFLKADRRDHPRAQEALQACREHIKANPPDSILDMYSNGLAVIFLCELSAQAHSQEIQWYLGRLKARQKDHGGWGYSDRGTGDTSQTQYGALAYWEAARRGIRIDGPSVEKLADWLLKTQDPDGCWGYQGNVSTTGQLVQQTEKSCSMLAAGLGSVYICADLFGATPSPQPTASQGDIQTLPAALRRVDQPAEVRVQKIKPERTNLSQLNAAMDRAHGWMAKNYTIDIGSWTYYYLYAMERYKSFQEQFEGRVESAPKWYNDGYQYLVKSQEANGSWAGGSGPVCDTAFATLFLLRSTKKSLGARLGEGTLVSGRGLPANLSRAKVRNGQLIITQVATKVDELLATLDEGDTELLDELAQNPGQLVVQNMDRQSARQLQQLVGGGEPEVRLLAVRALGRTGKLDYVPSLLYALTDPDRRVVLEARDALRFVSRNFTGHGPPDDFTDQQRYEALDAWKKWYQSLRPASAPNP